MENEGKEKKKLAEMIFVLLNEDFNSMTFTGTVSPVFVSKDVSSAKASHKGVLSRLQICTTIYQSEAGHAKASATTEVQ